MDWDKLILESDAKSVSFYLRRQELEASRQQINLEIMKIEQQLLKFDGEKDTLVRLKEMDKKDGE